MFKLVVTMKRKPGLTTEEFKRYYNDRHLPFVKATLPPLSGTTRTHFRNFPILDDPFLDIYLDGRGVKENPEFDCMTEVLFEDRESAIAYFKAFFEGEAYQKIKEDEENLVDLSTVKFHVVECIKTTRRV